MKDWEEILKNDNELAEYLGFKLRVDVCDGAYDVVVEWSDGEMDSYAYGYNEDELAGLINEAYMHYRHESFLRGDKVIRVKFYMDLPERSIFHPDSDFQVFGSVDAAVRYANALLTVWLNDDTFRMKGLEDVAKANELLAKKYEPNEHVYIKMDDVTEETIIKCSEAFCEHHWSFKVLNSVANELGIDWESMKKTA